MNNNNDDSEFRETNDESYKFYEKQLLLPTIYKLNLSFSKKMIIGFEEQKSDDLFPVVRLVGKDFIGILFKAKMPGLFPKGISYYIRIFQLERCYNQQNA